MDHRYTEPVALPLTPSVDEIPSPPVRVYGNGVSEYTFAETCKRAHPTRWIMAAGALLLGLFGFMAAGFATLYVGVVQGTFLWATMAVALGTALVGRSYRKKTAWRSDVCARRLYTAEVKGGVTTTVYPDRIEQTSSRWRQTLVFNNETRYVESRDWFTVENETVRVIVAATDVTPWEAQTMFEHIARAVPPARQFQIGRFTARREQSAPPPFSNEPPVCYERVEYREDNNGLVLWPRGLLPWLFAIALTVSGMFTVLFAITASFFLDYLIVFTACFIATFSATVALLHWRQNAGEDPATALSFTSEGLLIERTDREEFAAAADIHARRTADGVRLFTPAGVFTVPWSATAHRQQLEWMLFHQRPSSFQ